MLGIGIPELIVILVVLGILVLVITGFRLAIKWFR